MKAHWLATLRDDPDIVDFANVDIRVSRLLQLNQRLESAGVRRNVEGLSCCDPGPVNQEMNVALPVREVDHEFLVGRSESNARGDVIYIPGPVVGFAVDQGGAVRLQ